MKPLSSVSIRIGFADLLDPSRRRVHAMLQHRFGRTLDCQFAEAVQVLSSRAVAQPIHCAVQVSPWIVGTTRQQLRSHVRVTVADDDAFEFRGRQRFLFRSDEVNPTARRVTIRQAIGVLLASMKTDALTGDLTTNHQPYVRRGLLCCDPRPETEWVVHRCVDKCAGMEVCDTADYYYPRN